MNDFAEFMERARLEFLDEATFLIEQMEESFLKLHDSDNRSSELDEIFRAAHTIKGSSGAVGLTDLMEFSHVFEDLLGMLRKTPSTISEDMVTTMLQCCDSLRDRVQVIRQGSDVPWDNEKIVRQLEAYQMQIKSCNGCPSENTAACSGFAIFEDEGVSGSSCLSPADQTSPQTLIQVPPVERDASASREKRPQTNLVKIDAARVDAVFDLIGELVVIKSQLANKTESYAGDPELRAVVALLDKTVRELQDRSLAIRMTPMRSLFIKMQKMGRDIGSRLGKDVDIITSGEDTEVDRTMVEVLSDPLMHLLRNSLDHGLEDRAERTAAGKTTKGMLRISAQHIGERIMVRIEDDGRGIDRDRILKKAKENGLTGPDRDLTSFTDRELFQFLFHPGFSTAAAVTDLSGRGVGLDVVKTHVEKLRGTVDVISNPGKGTAFIISIPLTAAVTDGMAVQVGQQSFVIPMDAIRELVKIEGQSIVTIKEGKRVLRVRGSLLPMLCVRAYTARNGSYETERDISNAIAVVIEANDRRYALTVDSVIGQMQVVTKPIGKGIQSSPGIAGAAVLGDGRVALVMDINSLVKTLHHADVIQTDLQLAA